MNDLDIVYDAWNEGDFPRALRLAWDVDEFEEYPDLCRPDIGLDLHNLVFRACSFAIAASRNDRLESDHLIWIEELLERLDNDSPDIAPALVRHSWGDARADQSVGGWSESFLVEAIRAHLLCARALITRVDSLQDFDVAEVSKRIASECDAFPPGLCRDLLVSLAGSELTSERRTVVQTETLPVLLVDTSTSRGQVARLILELTAGGTRELVPAPAAIFSRDDAFRLAERSALEYVTRSGLSQSVTSFESTDIRWRVEDAAGEPVGMLAGGSMGAAFGLGMSKLLLSYAAQSSQRSVLQQNLFDLNLEGIALTATLEPGGEIGPVGGVDVKLIAAAIEEHKLHRLNTVAVSPDPDQSIRLERQFPHFLDALPEAEFRIVRANSIETLVGQLYHDSATRWRGIDCRRPESDRHFVGRRKLIGKIEEFIGREDSGYLVLVGGMGTGKSSLMAHLIEAAHKRGETPAFHIVGSDGDETTEPHAVAECLYTRLRRDRQFREPASWRDQALTAGVKLSRLLTWLSDSTSSDDERSETLFIDGADQIKLGRTKFLPGVLQSLPAGIKVILTSRPNLDWLGPIDQVEVWDLDEYVDDSGDVRTYLELIREEYGLALPSRIIESITEADVRPNFLTVNACVRELVANRTDTYASKDLYEDASSWLRAPEARIEHELWAICDRLQNESHGAITERDIWDVLGLPAIAMRALSEVDLAEFGLWDERVSAPVFEAAASLFRRRPLTRQPDLPYEFCHPGYRREIIARVGEHDLKCLHGRLAKSCTLWNQLSGKRREYALRWRTRHSLESRQWKRLLDAYDDNSFVIAHSDRMEGFAELHLCSRLASNDPNCPPDHKKEMHDVHLRLAAAWPKSTPKLELARVEKRVGLAVLNHGDLKDSIVHFNSALRFCGEWVPQSRVGTLVRVALDLWRLYRRKNHDVTDVALPATSIEESEREREIFEIGYGRCRAQNPTDAERSFVDNLAIISRFSRRKTADVEHACGYTASAAAFFAFGGVSFRIAHEFLERARALRRTDDLGDEFQYKAMAFVVHYLEGDWSREHDIDNDLLRDAMNAGFHWDADVYLGLRCERDTKQGHFESAELGIERLKALRKNYGYQFAKGNELFQTALLAIERGELDQAERAIDEYYMSRTEDPGRLLALSTKVKIQVLANNAAGAARTLAEAESLLRFPARIRFSPYYYGAYWAGKLNYVHAVTPKGPRGEPVGRLSDRAKKRALQVAEYCSRDKTEILELVGRLQKVG